MTPSRRETACSWVRPSRHVHRRPVTGPNHAIGCGSCRRPTLKAHSPQHRCGPEACAPRGCVGPSSWWKLAWMQPRPHLISRWKAAASIHRIAALPARRREVSDRIYWLPASHAQPDLIAVARRLAAVGARPWFKRPSVVVGRRAILRPRHDARVNASQVRPHYPCRLDRQRSERIRAVVGSTLRVNPPIARRASTNAGGGRRSSRPGRWYRAGPPARRCPCPGSSSYTALPTSPASSGSS